MSELLVKRGLFLPRKELFPEGKEASFLRVYPCPVDAPARSVTSPLEECNGEVVQPGTHTVLGLVHTVLGREGAYILRDVHLPPYQGGLYAPHDASLSWS